VDYEARAELQAPVRSGEQAYQAVRPFLLSRLELMGRRLGAFVNPNKWVDWCGCREELMRIARSGRISSSRRGVGSSLICKWG
jgi:hypothetical protein